MKMKQGQLSLHHDFNPSTASIKMVQDIMEKLARPGSAVEYSHWRNCDQCRSRQVVHMLTGCDTTTRYQLNGEIVTNVEVDKLSTC